MLLSSSVSSRQAFTVLAWAGILIWILLLFLQKTNLAASDLGRHLINGKVIIESGQVFQNNLYSYTQPDFPAPNHHWLFGVIAFSLMQAGGFSLVTAGIAAVYWVALVMTLLFSNKIAGSWPTLMSVVLLLPVIGKRVESRPEAFTSLFLVLTLWMSNLLWHHRSRKKILAASLCLFLIQVLWVNLHILFILGFLVTGSYLVSAFFSRSFSRMYAYVCLIVSQLLASLINPLGWKTLLYPLHILRDYQYPVAENQSLFFFLRLHPSPLYYYAAVLLVVIAAMAIVSYKKVPLNLKPIWLITLVLIAATAAMNRFSSFFQIPALIIMAYSFQQVSRSPRSKEFFSKNWINNPGKSIAVSLATVLTLAILFATGRLNPFAMGFGLGVPQNMESAGTFFKDNTLPGPIFNNYDIGGYLIYSLYPNNRVFIDNRPEAYPGDFVKADYIIPQENEARWQVLENEYRFNSIFFYRHDATNWAQPFLIRRLQDESWVPVYVDDYALILLKNTDANRELIEKLELPKSRFTVRDT